MSTGSETTEAPSWRAPQGEGTEVYLKYFTGAGNPEDARQAG